MCTTTTTTTLTTTRAGKAKDKHSKTKKTTKAEKANRPDLETELEPRYIIEQFYGLRNVFSAIGALLIGLNLFLMACLPGSKRPECACSVLWLANIAVSQYAVRKYKGTKHEEYGMNLCCWVCYAFFGLHEIVVIWDDSLASEEGRDAHVSMIFLTKYCIAFSVIRIMNNIRCKDVPWPEFVVLPAIAYKQPRFGIFPPGYEALAFCVALSLGYLIGTIIDGMSFYHYVAMHKKELEIKKKTQELSKESRRRKMAMEALSSYNDKSSFFEIR